MLPPEIAERHKVTLNELSYILEKAEVPSSLFEVSEEVPLSTLVVPIEDDSQGRTRIIACSFIPMDPEDLEHTELLQFYAQFPFEYMSERKAEISELLFGLNLLQPIGHFGLSATGELYLRYVYSKGMGQPLDEGKMIEITMMLEYGIETFQDPIESVNQGIQSAYDALVEIESGNVN